MAVTEGSVVRDAIQMSKAKTSIRGSLSRGVLVRRYMRTIYYCLWCLKSSVIYKGRQTWTEGQPSTSALASPPGQPISRHGRPDLPFHALPERANHKQQYTV